MLIKKMLPLLLVCLMLPACATERPVIPYPSTQELAEAYYGEFPEDYKYIISTYPPFRGRSMQKPAIDFGEGPAKTVTEWWGRYEYGWGGYLEIWLVDNWGGFQEKARYQYLIRDNKLILMEKFGFDLWR